MNVHVIHLHTDSLHQAAPLTKNMTSTDLFIDRNKKSRKTIRTYAGSPVGRALASETSDCLCYVLSLHLNNFGTVPAAKVRLFSY